MDFVPDNNLAVSKPNQLTPVNRTLLPLESTITFTFVLSQFWALFNCKTVNRHSQITAILFILFIKT